MYPYRDRIKITGSNERTALHIMQLDYVALKPVVSVKAIALL